MDGAGARYLLAGPAEDLLNDGKLLFGDVVERHVIERLGIGKVQFEPEVAPIIVGARSNSLDLLTLAEGEVCVDVLLGLFCNEIDIPLQLNSSVCYNQG